MKIRFPFLPLCLCALALPLSGLAQTIVPDPTAPPNPPVAPTEQAVRSQGAVLSRFRRLIRDVQSNTDNIKAVGNFGAQLYLIDDPNFFVDWRKPETPTINPIDLAVRGRPLFTAIIFYGEAKDAGGLANVNYDVTVRRPDGTIYDKRDSMIGYQSLAPADDRELQLGRNYLSIVVGADDPAGTYSVEMVVHDKVARTDLTLKQTFVVK